MSKSILQHDKECILSGYTGEYLDKHHIFGGSNRKKSERLGLWVYVHTPLHRGTPDSIHEDAELNKNLKKWAQRICMREYDMDVDDFIREFGKNYILTEGDWEVRPPFGRDYSEM